MNTEDTRIKQLLWVKRGEVLTEAATSNNLLHAVTVSTVRLACNRWEQPDHDPTSGGSVVAPVAWAISGQPLENGSTLSTDRPSELFCNFDFATLSSLHGRPT
jgi:hypothetical protein